MQRSRLFMLLTLVLLVVGADSFAQVINKKLTGQSFGGEIIINASPQAVWAVLTAVQKRGSESVGRLRPQGLPVSPLAG